MRLVLLLLLLACCLLNQVEAASSLFFEQKQKVRIYSNGSKRAQGIINLFKKFGIKYDLTNTLLPDANRLYLIFDAFDVDPAYLPKHYIVYQTRDLANESLDNDYMNILEDAVAIWDYSWENIGIYRHLISQYCYLPERCDCADPVLLPCMLPLPILNHYKAVLIESNTIDTEISSHLPALFCYSYANNPKIIVEVGVAGGSSSQTFNHVAQLLGVQLLGIDLSKEHEAIYKPLSNGLFIPMDDLRFADYYVKSFFKNLPIKLVFLGVTYTFQHSMQDIIHFVPLLARDGMIIFRDSNAIPLSVQGKRGWWRLNNTYGQMPEGSRPMCEGITRAIKNFFDLDFDEGRYQNMFFRMNDIDWHLVHYPFCNGLTMLKKINS